MLVGVLISIMISIVVGVNLVPTIITSINTASEQAKTVEGFSGLSGLMQVLAYVYIAVILLGRSNRLCPSKTSQIRGKLNLYKHANPELNSAYADKCVETRGFAPCLVMV